MHDSLAMTRWPSLTALYLAGNDRPELNKNDQLILTAEAWYCKPQIPGMNSCCITT